ncbi:hypothetical protein POF53_00985 [Mitsuaria sp. RG]|nr:hypothetical protein [Mitsuaria sp. RG]
MLLAKSCHTKDNVKSRGTVRLGSLHEYRNTEIQQIQDRKEGTLEFNLKFDGVVAVNKRELALLLQGLGIIDDSIELPNYYPGAFSVYVENWDDIGRTDESILLRDCSLVVSRQVHNSFIFCMSKVRMMKDARGLFPEYDDCWYVKYTDIDYLGCALGNALLKKVRESLKTDTPLISKDAKPDELEVQVIAQMVKYCPREVHIRSGEGLKFDSFMRAMETMAFIKPESFAHECEFRFQFFIEDKENRYHPLVNSVILDVDPTDIKAL